MFGCSLCALAPVFSLLFRDPEEAGPFLGFLVSVVVFVPFFIVNILNVGALSQFELYLFSFLIPSFGLTQAIERILNSWIVNSDPLNYSLVLIIVFLFSIQVFVYFLLYLITQYRYFIRLKPSNSASNTDGTQFALLLKNTSKKYGKSLVVNDVSFSVSAGECFGLLGPNGAGKSTTIKMISGLLSADSGGIEVYQPEASRVRIGVCSQHDILWDLITVQEHLELYSVLKQSYIDPKEISVLLEEMNLTSHASKKTCQLSGGMKRKLSLAIACLGSPAVVLLDECTNGMDPISRKKVYDFILRLKKTSAVILTSHEMAQVDACCDRIAILVNGKLKIIGEKEALKEQFGGGFRVYFKTRDKATVQAQVATEFPDLVLEYAITGLLVYRMSKWEEKSLPQFLRRVVRAGIEQNCSSFYVRKATLESAFIALAEKQDECI